MSIELELYKAAFELIQKRYPNGWGGAAAVRLENEIILTSIAPEVENAALALCMEVGALLEANKLSQSVTHSLCICRETEEAEVVILTPCGICQERLIYWGPNVQVAISNPRNELQFVPLRHLMPNHWSQVNGKKF